jgi:hypothetical protein
MENEKHWGISKMIKLKTEIELIILAEQNSNNNLANKAMRQLRERFDKTYIWCYDCDGVVCKEQDCCNIKNNI